MMDSKRRVIADLTGLGRPVRSWSVRSWSIALAAGLLLLMLTASLLLGAPTSNSLDWWVIGGGGDRISHSGNTLQGTLGQPLTGPVSAGGGNSLCAGFWCGVPPDYTIYLPLTVRQ